MQCKLLYIEGYFDFLNVLWFQLTFYLNINTLNFWKEKSLKINLYLLLFSTKKKKKKGGVK